MEFTIIKISESYASYKVKLEDKVWIGEIPGCVNGWQFEYKNKAGEYEYGSVTYEYGMPEDYVNKFEYGWCFETASWNGWEPTGRVIFRGYATEYYDSDEREWFVEDYDPEKERAYIVGYDQ